MRHLLFTGLMILLSATTATAAALPDADRGCRDALAKAVAHLAKAVMNEQVKCHATRLSGDPLFTAVDCSDIGTIAYNGGSLLGRPFPGAATTVADWVALNGCDPTPDNSPAALNLVTNLSGAETNVSRYATGCVAGRHTELWTINNGSHVPSLAANFAPSVVDFLLAHPKP